jgi:alpha-D-xyloside xylohydrolase
VTLQVFDLADGAEVAVRVPGGTGSPASFRVRRQGSALIAASEDAPAAWALEDVVTGRRTQASGPGEVGLDLA